MKEHVTEDQLTLHYYGEAEDTGVVRQHLAECPDCRAHYQNLQRVLNSVDAMPVPEPPEDYGTHVWTRLAPHLKRSRWRLWVPLRQWVPVAGVAALVVVAFLLGRVSHQVQKSNIAAAPAQVRERVLLVAVGDHLERSQMVLVELANATATQDVDLSGEKLLAENLVDSNRLFRQTAAAAGEQGVASVLEDLERVLLDVAHSPDTISGDELESLQKRIEEQGLLFKIRVVGSQIRERDSKPVQTGKTKL
jgi:predicted anti-sigma-YlaC factor YlaD